MSSDYSKLDDKELLTKYIVKRAQEKGVDPILAVAVFKHESVNFNKDVVSGKRKSPSGAIGPTQLMPGTAQQQGVNPYDPIQNIDGGLSYLKTQLDNHGNVEDALRAYNAGPGAVQKSRGYAETNKYVKTILGEIREKFPEVADAIPDTQAVNVSQRKKKRTRAENNPMVPSQPAIEFGIKPENMLSALQNLTAKKPSTISQVPQGLEDVLISGSVALPNANMEQTRRALEPTVGVDRNAGVVSKILSNISPTLRKVAPGIASVNTPEGVKTTAAEEAIRSGVTSATAGLVDLGHVDPNRFNNERERQTAETVGGATEVAAGLLPFIGANKAVSAATKSLPYAQRFLQALQASGRVGQAVGTGLTNATVFVGVQTAKELGTAYDSPDLNTALKNVAIQSAIGFGFGGGGKLLTDVVGDNIARYRAASQALSPEGQKAISTLASEAGIPFDEAVKRSIDLALKRGVTDLGSFQQYLVSGTSHLLAGGATQRLVTGENPSAADLAGYFLFGANTETSPRMHLEGQNPLAGNAGRYKVDLLPEDLQRARLQIEAPRAEVGMGTISNPEAPTPNSPIRGTLSELSQSTQSSLPSLADIVSSVKPQQSRTAQDYANAPVENYVKPVTTSLRDVQTNVTQPKTFIGTDVAPLRKDIRTTVADRIQSPEKFVVASEKTDENAAQDYNYEKDFSDKLLSGKENIRNFDYYNDYEKTVSDESKLIPKEGKKIFIGGGPIPISPMLMKKNHGIQFDVLDYNPEAVDIGKKVLKKEKTDLKVVRGDATNYDFSGYDTVFLSLEAGHTSELKKKILDNIKNSGVKTVIARSSADTEKGGDFVNTEKLLENANFEIVKKIPSFGGLGQTLLIRPREHTEAILNLHKKNSGSTYNIKNGDLGGTKNYSVSIYPERSKIVSGNLSDDEKKFKSTINDYLKSNSDLLSDSRNSVGTWYDKDANQTYIDVSTTIPSKRQAIELGKQYNQKAVFDLKNFEEIDTGGTGKPIENLPPENDRLAFITPKKSNQTLINYGSQARDEISPEGQGKGKAVASEQAKRKGPKKVYAYVEGAKPEAAFGRPGQYRRTIVGDRAIYDIGKDPDGIVKQLQSEGLRGVDFADELEHEIKNRGYEGYQNSKPEGRGIVTLFTKLPVKESVRLSEKETVAGGVKKVDVFSLKSIENESLTERLEKFDLQSRLKNESAGVTKNKFQNEIIEALKNPAKHGLDERAIKSLQNISDMWQRGGDAMSRYGHEVRAINNRKKFAAKEVSIDRAVLIKKASKKVQEVAKKDPTILYYQPMMLDKPSLSSVADVLSVRTIKEFGEVATKATKETKLDRAIEIGKSEILKQLAEESNGQSWYKADIDHLEKGLIAAYPELEDKTQMQFFKIILTVTSNGLTPVNNTTTAARIYDDYKKTGKIPLRPGSGKGWVLRQNILEPQLQTIQKLIDERGVAGLVEFMNEKQDADTHKKYSTTSAYRVSRGYGSFIFGSKLGAYYQNMNGVETELTTDRWWSRTWNRWMGTAFDKNGKLIDSPRDDKERAAMIASVEALQEELKAEGYDLSVSEIQAVLWYKEQQLWKAHGVQNVESYSYVDGIHELLHRKGINITDVYTEQELQSRGTERTRAKSNQREEDAKRRSPGKRSGESPLAYEEIKQGIAALEKQKTEQKITDVKSKTGVKYQVIGESENVKINARKLVPTGEKSGEGKIEVRDEKGRFGYIQPNFGNKSVRDAESTSEIVDNAVWVLKSGGNLKAPRFYVDDNMMSFISAFTDGKTPEKDEIISVPQGVAIPRSSAQQFANNAMSVMTNLRVGDYINDEQFAKLSNFVGDFVRASNQASSVALVGQPQSNGVIFTLVGPKSTTSKIKETLRHERFHTDQFRYVNNEHISLQDLINEVSKNADTYKAYRIAIDSLTKLRYDRRHLSIEIGAYLAGGPKNWNQLFNNENDYIESNNLSPMDEKDKYAAAYDLMGAYVDAVIEKYGLTEENLESQWHFIDNNMRNVIKEKSVERKQNAENEIRQSNAKQSQGVGESTSEREGPFQAYFLKDVQPTATEQQHTERTAENLVEKPERDSLLKTGLQLRKANLLTGTSTAARNITSNTTSLMLEEIAKVPASIIDIAVSRYTGMRTVTVPEVTQITRSLSEVRKKGWKEFKEAMKGNNTDVDITGWEDIFKAAREEKEPGGARAAELSKMDVRKPNTGFGLLDGYINTVFNFQSAQDRVFRLYAVRRSLEMQSEALAKTEVLQKKIDKSEVLERRKEILAGQNLSDEMKALMAVGAIEDSEFALFQNRNILTEKFEGFVSGIENYFDERVPGSGYYIIRAPVEQIMPFRKTPANVISRVIAYTPAGFIKTIYKGKQLTTAMEGLKGAKGLSANKKIRLDTRIEKLTQKIDTIDKDIALLKNQSILPIPQKPKYNIPRRADFKTSKEFQEARTKALAVYDEAIKKFRKERTAFFNSQSPAVHRAIEKLNKGKEKLIGRMEPIAEKLAQTVAEVTAEDIFKVRNSQKEFVESIGRGSIGSVLILLGFLAAASGNAIGYLFDKKKRNLRELANQPEGSIKVPGTDYWVKVSDAQPFGTLFTIGASAYEQWTAEAKSSTARMANVSKVATKIMLDHPMLSSMKESINAVGNPMKAGTMEAADAALKQATSFIPAFVRTTAKAIDPTVRKATTVGEEFKKNIPFLSKTVPSKTDVLGSEVKTGRLSSIIGIDLRKQNKDAVVNELVKHDVGISGTTKQKDEDKKATLDRGTMKGKSLRESLNAIIETSQYKNMNSADQKLSLKTIVEQAGKSKVDSSNSPLLAADNLRVIHNTKISEQKKASLTALETNSDFAGLSKDKKEEVKKEVSKLYNSYNIDYKAGYTPNALNKTVEATKSMFDKKVEDGFFDRQIKSIMRYYKK